ncbi:MAG: site-2 protease family protein [Verrucomicrobiales bacterium]|nr:site-2 protease family protein [Verrucomicrobiales bacterium]
MSYPSSSPPAASSSPSRRGFLGPSLQLGSVSGIPIRIHWSFSLLLLWAAFANYLATGSAMTMVLGVAFVLVVFGCVILHELGHSLTALRFGIRTRSITLSPLGGIAALESSPRDWKQELWITVAGPAVNAVIAALLLPFVILTVNVPAVLGDPFASAGGFLFMVFAANVMLVLFNLIPAFPMDGGRIFRSLLTPVTNRWKATQIASTTGQVCAIAMAGIGLFTSPFLVLISVFVFLAAAAERKSVEMDEALSGTRVSDAMRHSFETASHSDTVNDGIALALRSGQNTVPVMFNGQLLGLTSLHELIQARATGRGHLLLSQLVDGDLPYVTPGDELLSVFRKMQQGHREVVPVIQEKRLVGLLPQRSIRSLLQLRAA